MKRGFESLQGKPPAHSGGAGGCLPACCYEPNPRGSRFSPVLRRSLCVRAQRSTSPGASLTHGSAQRFPLASLCALCLLCRVFGLLSRSDFSQSSNGNRKSTERTSLAGTPQPRRCILRLHRRASFFVQKKYTAYTLYI